MKSKTQETKLEAPKQNPVASGFITNVMPVLGKTGEYVYFFLPGDITITEHANRIKGVLGIEYTPKSKPTERREYQPQLGLHARIQRITLSQDGEWVTIHLPGRLGKICNHINAYNFIFQRPYVKKAQPAPVA